MLIDFAPAPRSSMGIEWELALVDLVSGELTRMFKLAIEQAQALNDGEPLYDTMLEGYERGTTTAERDRLFSALGPALSARLLRIEERKAGSPAAAHRTVSPPFGSAGRCRRS